MHISRLALLGAFAGLAAAAPSALASDAQTVSPTAAAATWTSPVGSGINNSYFLDDLTDAGECGDIADPQTACDKTLVRVTGVVGEGSTVKFAIDGFQPYSDFDLRVYTADAEGNLDAYLGSPTGTAAGDSSPLGSDDPRYTSAGDFEYKTVPVDTYADPETGEIDQYFAVVVPYFLVFEDSYDGHATLDAKPFVAPEPDEEPEL